MTYCDVYLIPVAAEKLEAYRQFSGKIAAVYREYGALRIVDCLLDDATGDGSEFHAEGARDEIANTTLRTFRDAAASHDGEVVVFSRTEWPSKAVRDAALPRILADPRVQPQAGEDTIFDGGRLVSGAFSTLMET